MLPTQLHLCTLFLATHAQLWFFHRRFHPTRLITCNLVPGSPLEIELNTPPSNLSAAAAAATEGKNAKKGKKVQGSKDRCVCVCVSEVMYMTVWLCARVH